jgi:hypothetical protein
MERTHPPIPRAANTSDPKPLDAIAVPPLLYEAANDATSKFPPSGVSPDEETASCGTSAAVETNAAMESAWTTALEFTELVVFLLRSLRRSYTLAVFWVFNVVVDCLKSRSLLFTALEFTELTLFLLRLRMPAI